MLVDRGGVGGGVVSNCQTWNPVLGGREGARRGGRKLHLEGSCKEDLPKISRLPKVFSLFCVKKSEWEGCSGRRLSWSHVARVAHANEAQNQTKKLSDVLGIN